METRSHHALKAFAKHDQLVVLHAPGKQGPVPPQI